jgi:hypothetical protein
LKSCRNELKAQILNTSWKSFLFIKRYEINSTEFYDIPLIFFLDKGIGSISDKLKCHNLSSDCMYIIIELILNAVFVN